MYKGKFQAFRGKNIQEGFTANHQKISEHIKRERLDTLLSLDEERYIRDLAARFTLNTPQFELDKMRNQRGEVDNLQYNPTFNRRKKIPTVIYFLPYKGDGSLFQYNPTHSWSGEDREVSLVDNDLTFEIIDEGNNEQVREQKQRVVDYLQQQLSILAQEVADYNSQLPNFIKQTLQAHKQHLTSARKKLDYLL